MNYSELPDQSPRDARRDQETAGRVAARLRAQGIERGFSTNPFSLIWQLRPAEVDEGLRKDVAKLGAEIVRDGDEVLLKAPRHYTLFKKVELVPYLLAVLGGLFALNLGVYVWRAHVSA